MRAAGCASIENFAPFLFCGLEAAANWSAGFRAHSAADELKNLAATFGEAHDFKQSGKRAYFSLPATWTGLTHGKRFEEHGAWSFVLEREDAGWRIVGYRWGSRLIRRRRTDAPTKPPALSLLCDSSGEASPASSFEFPERLLYIHTVNERKYTL